MKRNFFGVDFGTTNTAIAYITKDEHGTKAVTCGEGDLAMPYSSLVAIHKVKGTKLFSQDVRARRQQLAKDYFLFSSFKSDLGKGLEYEIAGQRYTPADITALFLKYIKDDIKARFELDLEQATFAIPVDFTSLQRKELKLAAEKAGVKVSKMISESTAAYMHNKDEVQGMPMVAVFDWGGGTLDTSILKIEKNILRELCVKGERLGGDDIDRLLAEKIHVDLVKRQKAIGTYEEMSSQDRDNILKVAEDTKIKLSDEDSVRIRLVDYGKPGILFVPFDNSRFTDIIRGYTEKAMALFHESIDDAGISKAHLDAIIMVGGSCHLRPIQHEMEEQFYEKGTSVIYPEKMQWSSAVGAAMIEVSNTAYRLSQQLGVLLSDNTIHPLFAEGDIVPTAYTEKRFGVVENTTDAHFIFCHDDKKPIHIENVPVKGFIDEEISLHSELEESLIGTITLKSTHMAGKSTKKVELRNLRFCYDLEGFDDKKKKPDNIAPTKNPELCKYLGCSEKATLRGYCYAHYKHEHADSK